LVYFGGVLALKLRFSQIGRRNFFLGGPPYLSEIQKLLSFFRAEIARHRSADKSSTSLYDEVPLIIHHTLPFNLNSNAFVSPYNKLAKWVAQLEAKGFFGSAPSDPHTPNYAIPAVLAPPSGWEKSFCRRFNRVALVRQTYCLI
jgi:hypothetical protein